MKDFIKNNKLLLIIFSISIFLVLLFSILKLNSFIFISCSIAANIFLIGLIRYIRKKINIEITTKELLFLLLTSLLLLVFYTYSIYTSKFIYYWDFSCYYNIQLQTIETFKKGLFEGARYFVGSTWSGEYGNFLSFFPQILFQFTNKSINSYMMSFIITFIPYVLYSFSILIKTVEKHIALKPKDKSLLFYLSIFTLSLFPLLHGVLVLGQPDFFGLTFIFLIISITLKYDFKKIEIDRLIVIFLLTFMLTICRRWYIYWIATYYLIYIANIIITNFKNKKDLLKIIRNVIIYGVVVIILYLITLFPFIKNVLLSNYSSSYSFYSAGGALKELTYQFNHIGILVFMLIIGGLVFGIITKRYRRYTISAIIQYFLIVILFTKIQSMGLHHSLLLLVLYFYGLYIFIICILKNKKRMRKILLFVFLTVILSNALFSYVDVNSKLFTDINLKIQGDEDYDSIGKIVKWLDKNLDQNNQGYLITHNNTINPDKLRNYKTPISTTKKYLPYGSAVIGVHKFPLELFTAKYVMTTTPFESISVEEKYNKVFKELVSEGKFKLVKEQKLKNNIKFEIYERVEPVSNEEKEKYIAELKDESKEFKNLYEDVINSYTIS